MTDAPVDLTEATAALAVADAALATAVQALKAAGGADTNQVVAYDVSHAASALATAHSMVTYGAKGPVGHH